MNILVFSDSHGHTDKIINVLQQHSNIDYIIHLGDYGTDIAAVQEFNPLLLTDVVQGNNDKLKIYPLEKVLFLAGKRILITHGHSYNVGHSLAPILARGSQDNVDAILFGHTHIPLIEKIENVMIVNPGSIFRQRCHSVPTYAILRVSKDVICAEICKV